MGQLTLGHQLLALPMVPVMRLLSQTNPSAGSLVVAVEALMRSCCLRPFKNLKMAKTAKIVKRAKRAKRAKMVKRAKMAKMAKMRLLPLAQKAVNLTTLQLKIRQMPELYLPCLVNLFQSRLYNMTLGHRKLLFPLPPQKKIMKVETIWFPSAFQCTIN